jgi:hypothetical protein
VTLGVLASAGAAAAHVGPSVEDNNRYIKLTVFGNRIRLLYTFYLGQQPGRQTRARIDRRRDGHIDEAESRAFGDEIAEVVAKNLELRIDGEAHAPSWHRVDVGLGTPTTDAGALSVDLVAWLCLDQPATRTTHGLVLFDHWKPPFPGENEVFIEESPGVDVRRARFGADGPVSQLRFRWVAGSPLDSQGLFIDFAVDPAEAETAPTPGCPGATAATTAQPRRARWPLIAAGLGVIAIASLLWRARRAQRNTNG